MTEWQTYQPTDSCPWRMNRAVHLHRRTVFGPTWNEIQRDIADHPHAAVDRIIHGECRSNGVPDDYAVLADLISNSAAQSQNSERVKAAWIFRCLFSPDPLRERLTLMWHNHFATSNLKVANLHHMTTQNATLRQHAKGQFKDLLKSLLRDPALLLWLDASANRRGHPNENLARELMELFTLGIGHYGEDDVKQAARALTGLTVHHDEFRFLESRHDAGSKTILGTTAEFDADQLCHLLLEHPATARRIAWRLTREFFGEGVVSDRAMSQLSQQLQESHLNIGQAVETMLHSELFFSDANMGSRICDPMSFLIAPLRALEMFEPPPSTLLLTDWLQRMGLDLFYPPNVGGWEGGRTWLTTRTVIARANYAAAVVDGKLHRPVTVPNLKSIAAAYGQTSFTRFVAPLFACVPITDATSTDGSSLSDEGQLFIHMMTQPTAHLH